MDKQSSDLIRKIKERLSSNKLNYKNTIQKCSLSKKNQTISISKCKTINPNCARLNLENNFNSVQELLENENLEAPTPQRILSVKNAKIINLKLSNIVNIKNFQKDIACDIINNDNDNDEEINFNTNEIKDNFYKNHGDKIDNNLIEEIKLKESQVFKNCCKSAKNLDIPNSVKVIKIKNKQENIKKEKLQKVFSLSLRTILSPVSKCKKQNILFDYIKKEEEIKNIITPKSIKKKEYDDKFYSNDNKKYVPSNEKTIKNKNFKKPNLYDDEYYKNELKKNTNFFNEPIKRHIILNSKSKKEKSSGQYKNKICNLHLNLDNEISNNYKQFSIVQKNQNEFQQFLNTYKNNNKFIDGNKSNFYLPNSKERIFCPVKLKSRNDKKNIKKQSSLFKNEQIKFLNNL